jgi:hypothetical protein
LTRYSVLGSECFAKVVAFRIAVTSHVFHRFAQRLYSSWRHTEIGFICPKPQVERMSKLSFQGLRGHEGNQRRDSFQDGTELRHERNYGGMNADGSDRMK